MLTPDIARLDLSLYSAGLIDTVTDGDGIVGWRGTLNNRILKSNTTLVEGLAPYLGPFSSACGALAGLDGYTYGARAFDEVLLRADLETGAALGVEIRDLLQGLIEKAEASDTATSKVQRDENLRLRIIKTW